MIFIKRVGIIIREFEENNINFIGTRNDLFNTLNKFIVSIIGIPINIELDKVIDAINLCDGIILSGGSKFCDNDFKIVEYLYKNNIPTLGICLGMQSMAEYFNNKKEIKADNHYSTDLYVHKVKINKKSLLYKIINKEEIMVNSRHHDAVPFTDMDISATSPDGVIEGVELPNHKFFVGVQWHPESIDDNNSYQLFKYFIENLK